jgi:hypothetical protein
MTEYDEYLRQLMEDVDETNKENAIPLPESVDSCDKFLEWLSDPIQFKNTH